MKILVIGPSWIGDMVMSHSMYQLLVTQYPDVKIDVMAPAWCQPLLNRMSEVSNALLMPLGHGTLALRERYRLGYSLRNSNYQQVIVLPNSLKSALVPFFAGIPQRTGWLGEIRYGLLNDIRILDKHAFPLMVQRYAALAFKRQKVHSAADLPQPLPWPHLVIRRQEVDTTLTTFNFCSKRPIIGFCPGSEFGPAKRWPHYHYATLAQMLIKHGYKIVLFGSAKDYEAGQSINNALPIGLRNYCCNLIGKTSLDQAVLLITACKVIISNDSGLMHIASALQRPLIVLYGPSSPNFTPPLSHQARVIRLINGYYKVRKSDKVQQGYHQSLIDIQPYQVLNKLKEFLLSEEN